MDILQLNLDIIWIEIELKNHTVAKLIGFISILIIILLL